MRNLVPIRLLPENGRERIKDEFLATISHELRTPLTSVLGWVRMLRAGNLDHETTLKAMDVIDRNVRFQAQLIEDLLDISRITMGKLRLDVRPVQPAAIINAAVEALQLAADARQVRIQTVLEYLAMGFMILLSSGIRSLDYKENQTKDAAVRFRSMPGSARSFYLRNLWL